MGARSAHSIYFEVLGETGFVGLGLFVLLGATTIPDRRQPSSA